jgi:hypothetical protein
MRLSLDFELINAKIRTHVGLLPAGAGKYKTVPAIFDLGNNITAISPQMFKMLEVAPKDAAPVTIDTASPVKEGDNIIKGFTTIIYNFELGGEDIGPVRIVVGPINPKFRDYVILGMNILQWFDTTIRYRKGEIYLAERMFKFGTTEKNKRFVLKDPATAVLLIKNEIDGNGDGSNE